MGAKVVFLIIGLQTVLKDARPSDIKQVAGAPVKVVIARLVLHFCDCFFVETLHQADPHEKRGTRVTAMVMPWPTSTRRLVIIGGFTFVLAWTAFDHLRKSPSVCS